MRTERTWGENAIELLKVVGEMFVNALERKRSEETLKESLTQLSKKNREIEELKNRLQAENVYLREKIRTEHDFEEIIGESQALKNVLRKVEQVAPTDTTVLIQGETGTGKELIADAIHNLSPRRDRSLIAVFDSWLHVFLPPQY